MPAITTPGISMYPGEDKTVSETVYQADGTTPQNITGWAVSAVLHAYNDPTTVLFTKTVGSGITLTNAAGGVMTIALTAASTSGIAAGTYQFRVERTDSGADAVLTLVDFTLLQK